MLETPAYIQDWRGDETLYSWVCGFHLLMGNGSARKTGQLLFSAEHAARVPDAPSNLHHFVQITNGLLGNELALLLDRTALGVYIRFLPAARYRVLLERIALQRGGGWRTLCGMLASGLGTGYSLKYCDTCISEAAAIWGVVNWRLCHQLTGVWICPDHHQPLLSVNSIGAEWLLPRTGLGVISNFRATSTQHEAILHMAKLATSVATMSGRLDLGSVSLAVMDSLRQLAVVGWAKPIEADRLARWFQSTPISTWLRAETGDLSNLASGRWILDLLRGRRVDHPIKWLSLWCSVFSHMDAGELLRRLVDVKSAQYWRGDGQGVLWSDNGLPIPADIEILIKRAPSISSAAAGLGMSAASLRRRLARLGVSVREMRARSELHLGRERAMNAIQGYITDNPSCSRSDVHRECKAAVEWIRTHEPSLYLLLVQSIPDLRSPQRKLVAQ